MTEANQPEKVEAPKRVTAPKNVTLRNRTIRTIVAVDSNGDGVHIPPKGSESIPASRMSDTIRSLAAKGLIRIL